MATLGDHGVPGGPGRLPLRALDHRAGEVGAPPPEEPDRRGRRPGVRQPARGRADHEAARQFQDLRSKGPIPTRGSRCFVALCGREACRPIRGRGSPLRALWSLDTGGNRGQLRALRRLRPACGAGLSAVDRRPGENYPARMRPFPRPRWTRGRPRSRVKVSAVTAPGCEFILIDTGPRAAPSNLGEARASGSIVLASPPLQRKNLQPMIIKPKVRGFVCVTAHPAGCAAHVAEWIKYVKSKGSHSERPEEGPGDRGVDGLRPWRPGVTARFWVREQQRWESSMNAPPRRERTATPGWYNTIGFTKAAHAEGLYAKNINGDGASLRTPSRTRPWRQSAATSARWTWSSIRSRRRAGSTRRPGPCTSRSSSPWERRFRTRPSTRTSRGS